MKRVFIIISFLVINRNFNTAQEYHPIIMEEIFRNVLTYVRTIENKFSNTETVFISIDIIRTTKLQYRELEPNCKYYITALSNSKLLNFGLTIYSLNKSEYTKTMSGDNSGTERICILELNTNEQRYFAFQVNAVKFVEGSEAAHYGLIIVRINQKKN